MWHLLIKENALILLIDKHFLNAIKALYTIVLAAVRNDGETSNYFQCSNGL